MKNEQKVIAGLLIYLASTVFMILVQIPTPNQLNPLGAFFAIVWVCSGAYTAIGALFTYG